MLAKTPIPDNTQEHLLRCLARFVLRFPTKQRRQAWLLDYQKRHGQAGADKLCKVILEEHAKARATAGG